MRIILLKFMRLCKKYFVLIVSLFGSCNNLYNEKLGLTENCELSCMQVDFGATSYFFPNENKSEIIDFIKNTDSIYYKYLIDNNLSDSPYIVLKCNNKVQFCFLNHDTFLKIKNIHNNLDSLIYNNQKVILNVMKHRITVESGNNGFEKFETFYIDKITKYEIVQGITKCI